MKSVYVLRHSERDPGYIHLNDAGVNLARACGQQLGPMARVITSPALRCIETAVALGFAVHEESDLLALPNDDVLMSEVDRISSYDDAAQLIRRGARLAVHAQELRRFIETVCTVLLEHQDALLVTHGGIVETIAVALAGADAAELGDAVGYCQGVRLMMERCDDPGDSDPIHTVQWTVQRLCT